MYHHVSSFYFLKLHLQQTYGNQTKIKHCGTNIILKKKICIKQYFWPKLAHNSSYRKIFMFVFEKFDRGGGGGRGVVSVVI